MKNQNFNQTWKKWGNTITLALMLVVAVHLVMWFISGLDAPISLVVILMLVIFIVGSPLVYMAYREENEQVKNTKYKKNKIKAILEVEDFQTLYKDSWDTHILVDGKIYKVAESEGDILGIKFGEKLIYSRQLEKLRVQIEEILEVDNFQEVEIDDGRDKLSIQANDTNYEIHTAGNEVIYVTSNGEVVYQAKTKPYI